MIRIAVCDDEKFMSDQMKQMAAAFFRKKHMEASISQFSCGDGLLDKILKNGNTFDILFLDIRMEGTDGLKVAEKLRSQGFRGYLVFVTALEELVFESFQVQPFDYLVKPIREDLFERTMERLCSSLWDLAGKNLLIRQGSGSRIVAVDEIVFCEVIDRKVYLHIKSGEVIDYYERIASLEERLGEGFFRCHRSYLINLQYLRGFKNEMAFMEGGRKIPVSRLRSREFSNVILRYMKKRSI